MTKLDDVLFCLWGQSKIDNESVNRLRSAATLELKNAYAEGAKDGEAKAYLWLAGAKLDSARIYAKDMKDPYKALICMFDVRCFRDKAFRRAKNIERVVMAQRLEAMKNG